MSKISNIYPHGLKPNYFHVKNMQYLPTWSETGIDISTLNYFHVQNMQCLHAFIHMV